MRDLVLPIAVLLMGWWFYLSIQSVAVMKVAYPSLECKEVVSQEPRHSCDNLPETYEVMWVSPAYKPEEGR